MQLPPICLLQKPHVRSQHVPPCDAQRTDSLPWPYNLPDLPPPLPPQEPRLRRLHVRTANDIKMDPERPEYHRAIAHWARPGECAGPWLVTGRMLASKGAYLHQRALSCTGRGQMSCGHVVLCTTCSFGCLWQALLRTGRVRCDCGGRQPARAACQGFLPPSRALTYQPLTHIPAAAGAPEGAVCGELVAASTGGQISSRLLSLRSANVLLEIPQVGGWHVFEMFTTVLRCF